MGIEWDARPANDATAGTESASGAETVARGLARASGRAAWRAWLGGLLAFIALDWVVALTVPPASQTLWRVLSIGFASFGAAGYFWMSVPGTARPARLLVWFTQVAYCGVYALLELTLTAFAPGVATIGRVAMVALSSAATVYAFNRLTGRLIERDAAERAALERAHADSLRLEGVLLAAHTMQHRLNDALTVTSAYAEMLAKDAALSPQARGRALVVLHTTQDAAEQLAALGQVTRVEEDTRFVVPLLDLERSMGAGAVPMTFPAAGERSDERIGG